MDHYYVFFVRSGDPIPHYERTCGTVQAAQDRCNTLQGRGYQAYYMLNELPPEGFYY